MKFKVKITLNCCSENFDGFGFYGVIPEGCICEVKLFEGFPVIFYKGKAVCELDSQMAKDYFEKVKDVLHRKYTIYAVDFDGTLCEIAHPSIGSPNMALIRHLIKRRKQGNKIILWTCRVDERLQEAVEWCKSYGLEFDAVNENLPEMVEYWGNDSRKVFADVYIDDKAVNKPKYNIPYKKECL